MNKRKFLAACMACGLLAGCAVHTQPLSRDEILSRLAADRGNLYKDQEPISGPVTMEEAMARSIKYNLEHRLRLMESALALRQVDAMTYDMLPRLVTSAGYISRNSYSASSSMNVYTEQQSLAPSTSQDKQHSTADLTLTWNILDFGVSYFQAKQQADRALIMKERQRKAVHNIMQQLRQAYWLALGAQQLETKFDPLLKEVDTALQDVNRIDSEKLRAPLETLNYRKTLLEIIKQLESFRDELAQAKPRLASLMNLPPGQSFQLAPPASMEVPSLTLPLEAMEGEALTRRPELREADYNERISVFETRKAIARLFPGIELNIGGHYDSNSFLVDKSWLEGSARITWNLFNLLTGPVQYQIAKSQTDIAQAQRLTLSMAILTQVHVSFRDFVSRKRQYDLAEQLQEVDARIHVQTMTQTATGVQNRLNEIRTATAALMAEYRRYQNYAALQNAYGQMIATLGVDPLPETVTGHDVQTLTQAIQAAAWKPEPVPATATPEKRL